MKLIDGITQTEETRKVSFGITVALAIGIILLVSGPKLGIAGGIVTVLAILAIPAGWAKFKPSEEVGALKVADQFVKDNDGKTKTVSGMTILAPYPPFYVEVVRVDIRLKSLVFPMKIMTVEEFKDDRVTKSFSVEGTLTIPAIPDNDRMDRYTQVGGFDKIKEDMGNLPYRVVQHIVTHHRLTAMELVTSADKITALLEDHIINGRVVPGSPDKNGKLKGEFFGFKPYLPTIDFKLSDDILTTMSKAAQAKFENDARMAKTEADLLRADKIKVQVSTPEGQKAWQAMLDAELLEDGGLTKLVVEGSSAGAIIVRDTHIHMPEK